MLFSKESPQRTMRTVRVDRLCLTSCTFLAPVAGRFFASWFATGRSPGMTTLLAGVRRLPVHSVSVPSLQTDY